MIYLKKYTFLILTILLGCIIILGILPNSTQANHNYLCISNEHTDEICSPPAEINSTSTCSSSDILLACNLDLSSGHYFDVACFECELFGPGFKCDHTTFKCVDPALATPTPPPPTATPPPDVCGTSCTLSPCTQFDDKPGVYQVKNISCGPGCCAFDSQVCVGSAICPVPTPACVSEGSICGGASPCCGSLTCMPPDIYDNRRCANVPTSTPTPTAIPSCPGGTIEKTVTSSGVSPQPCTLKGAGDTCFADSECCSNDCNDIYFTCAAPPPLPSSSYTVTSTIGRNTSCISYSNFSAVPPSSQIRHTREMVFPDDCNIGNSPWEEKSLEAIFNFNGFNIPKSSFIRWATLFSPASGFQAGNIRGRSSLYSTAEGNSFSSYTNINSRFGSDRMAGTGCSNPFDSCCKNFFTDSTMYKNFCNEACRWPQWTQGSSGLPSGTANATGFVQVHANLQDLTSASFWINAEWYGIFCGNGWRDTVGTGNFSVGGATLTINYCEVLPTPTPTLIPTATLPPVFTPTPTSTPIHTPTPTPTIGPCPTISGRVYVDTNENQAEDKALGELGYSGAEVSAELADTATVVATDTTDGSLFPSPNYSFPSLCSPSYDIRLTVPVNYTATTTNPLNSQTPPTTVSFGILAVVTPTPTQSPTPTPVITPSSTPTPTLIPTSTPIPTPTPIIGFWGESACVKDGIATLDCIPAVIKLIIQALLLFAGIVAVFLIIHSGSKFVLSSGDPKRIEEARNTLTYAVMGLIIVLAAFLIVNLVSFVTGVKCLKYIGFICL